jgi:hypothetical protein
VSQPGNALPAHRGSVQFVSPGNPGHVNHGLANTTLQANTQSGANSAHGHQFANGGASANVRTNHRHSANQSGGIYGGNLMPAFWTGSGGFYNSTFGVPYATSYGQPDAAYPTFAPGPAFASQPTVTGYDGYNQPDVANSLANLSFDNSLYTRRQQLYGSIRQPLIPVPNVEPTAAEWHHILDVLLTNRLVERGTAPFTRAWLKDHKYVAPWGYRQSKQWAWGSTGFEVLNEWLGTDWNLNASPIIYYGQNDVQVPYPVAAVATEECLALADQKITFDPKWMPLGVFGLLPPRAGTFATTVQLAVNRQGLIRGYAIDSETKRIGEVRGALDRSTLRLAFSISGTDGGSDARKFETSAVNLLQGESLVNVYQPGEQTVAAWDVVRDPPHE